jgi:streptomycin 6-kinase
MYGYVGIALPVTQGGRPRVLKVGWIDEHTEHEALALATWAGSGAVRLFGHDPTRGALLLERLDPAVTLESVPVHQAVEVAASLLRRLSVPGPTGPRPMAEIVKRRAREIGPDWERLDRQLPATIVDTAISASARLGSDTAGLLVNEDLHFGNVLRGEREPWLVIDPKPVIGDPEWAVAPLLWNRFPESNVERSIERRFETIVDVARLDRDRARGWTLLRIVETRLWSLRQSLTDDAARCAAIARVLAG